MGKKRVAYFYDQEIGNFHYGDGHPMKPHRVRMTHDLITSYDLIDSMDLYTPIYPSIKKLTQFHTNDYIDFLYSVNSENITEFSDQAHRFNFSDDCPVFDGLWDFCNIYSGGSIDGVKKIMDNNYDIGINWAGGLHHGKKYEASGFCYINDCVLAALEFLRYKHRILYLDIDVHHGDGVEEAFYSSPRVMCCSFHKHGDYFPGTGSINDIGVESGKGYSVNIPLKEGIDDIMFSELFEKVADIIMCHYRPEAVIIQSGADSLSGDRLGCFNLSIEGHSCAVQYFKNLNIPILLLGGGGYTLRNVPRCWAYETALITGNEVIDEIPLCSQYYGYYGPNYNLHFPITQVENKNNQNYIQKIIECVTENFREYVSSVCTNATMYPKIPSESFEYYNEIDEEDNDIDINYDKPMKEILLGYP